MSFTFTQRKDTAGQVRQMAADQIESAIDIAKANKDFDKTVHDLRRRCKKIRGLMRLVRPNFKQFDDENAAFRDAADSLSASRDAAVIVETFDLAAKESWAEDVSWARKQQLRDALLTDLRRVEAEQDRGELLADFASAMQRALDRVEDWSLDGDGFQLIRAGLRDTYGDMRKRMEKVARTGDPVDYHDWRKDTKNHWFHVGILSDTAPYILNGRRDNLSTLGDYLGDHHNLTVLIETLEKLTGPLDAPVARGLAAEQQKLADKALPLGRQLTVENPAALVSRFNKFWKLLPKED